MRRVDRFCLLSIDPARSSGGRFRRCHPSRLGMAKTSAHTGPMRSSVACTWPPQKTWSVVVVDWFKGARSSPTTYRWASVRRDQNRRALVRERIEDTGYREDHPSIHARSVAEDRRHSGPRTGRKGRIGRTWRSCTDRGRRRRMAICHREGGLDRYAEWFGSAAWSQRKLLLETTRRPGVRLPTRAAATVTLTGNVPTVARR